MQDHICLWQLRSLQVLYQCFRWIEMVGLRNNFHLHYKNANRYECVVVGYDGAIDLPSHRSAAIANDGAFRTVWELRVL